MTTAAAIRFPMTAQAVVGTVIAALAAILILVAHATTS